MKKKRINLKENNQLLLLALPGLIWFIVFSYLPLIGNVIAFKDFKIHKGGFLNSLIQSDWVGLDNFEFLFSSSDTLLMLRNTIGYNLLFIVLGTAIPIIIAISINELRNKRAAKVYQSIMFFPYFLSWVVVSYFLFAFLDPSKGLINAIREAFGYESINFYLEPKYWPYFLVALNIWKGLGYGTVLYLASIVGIDKTYYEAAMLDGATKMQQIRYITLPFLKPVVTILVILSVSKILNSDFGLFYQVPRNSGALYSVTQTVDTFVYRAMTSLGDIGMSSAAALFQSTVGCVLVLLSNWLITKIDKENAIF
ncbi:ABC transporter permease [Candidatus Epulonipiscium viviparus]|uniref:ABC transporter permease n=1 Tax=Candidatus Epulonipiscium viviparus TaxID=420336 RepID=UPI000495EDFC|nr:ABC transporter permease subunit [Candidatus Epulopiscium viviparus]